jgi:hypothetical protein
VLGTLIAFVAAVFLAIVGFVWYPIKRLLKRRKQPVPNPELGRRELEGAQATRNPGKPYSQ